MARAGGKARTPNSKGLFNSGRIGVNVVEEKYDLGFYGEIGKKGGSSVKRRFGSEFHSEIGKLGSEIRTLQRGVGYYGEIGKLKGGQSC